MQLNTQALDVVKNSFAYLYQTNIQAKRAIDGFFKGVGEILSFISMGTYRKRGYPLGKSNRGFKKWQTRQLFKK